VANDSRYPLQPAVADPFWLVGFGRPVPHLLDTSVLFRELHGLARQERARLLGAAQMGHTLLFVPAHVEVEIVEKLPKIARAARVPLETVQEAWRQYATQVRVVDAVPAERDPRRLELAADDPDDVGFADLVALMGPILAFSTDSDLTERGLATDQWRDVPGLTMQIVSADYAVGVPPTAPATRSITRSASRGATQRSRCSSRFSPCCSWARGDLSPPGSREIARGRLGARP
jgi:hypothetical protein